MKNKVLQYCVIILCSESCLALAVIIVLWFVKSPHDFDSIRHLEITNLLSKSPHDLWNCLMILTASDIQKTQTCCQNCLMIYEIASWFWLHQTCGNHRLFCDFPPWEPSWLRFSTLNSPKSSLIITLWLTYHYNPNSSLTSPFSPFNSMVHFTLCYFSRILISQ
jgi:hypothetical protein